MSDHPHTNTANGNSQAPAATPAPPAPSVREPLREARAKLALKAAEMRLHYLEQQERSLGLAPQQLPPAFENQLREASSIFPDCYPMVFDPSVAYAGDPFMPPFSVYANPGDRARGQNRPFFQSDAMLDYWPQASRMAVQTSSHVEGLQRNLCNYRVKSGYKLKAVPNPDLDDADATEPGKQMTAQTKQAVKVVNKVIKHFVKTNSYNWMQREAIWDVH